MKKTNSPRGAACAALLLLASSSGWSAALILPAASGPTAPGIAPVLAINSTPASFNGTWSSPALTPWQGTFHSTGPYPSGATGSSTSTWDFTTLNAGILPSSTYFRFGDLDAGSGPGEIFRLRAFDASNALILTPWLDTTNVNFISGANPGDFVQGSMPSWSFNAVNGVYTFDGSAVAGNPSVTISLLSTQAIQSLEVKKATTSYGFGLAAPTATPEPGSLAMLATGLGLVALRRVRRQA